MSNNNYIKSLDKLKLIRNNINSTNDEINSALAQCIKDYEILTVGDKNIKNISNQSKVGENPKLK